MMSGLTEKHYKSCKDDVSPVTPEAATRDGFICAEKLDVLQLS